MATNGNGQEIDYYPCRYGQARSVFRGPPIRLDMPYVAVIGGSEVYGPYVEDPFVDQMAERTGRRIVNLGVMNGGLEVFLRDQALMDIVAGAETVIVQLLGAHNLSNRYYAVHPRRNDRFVRQSRMLKRLYCDVDFTEFTFTRHLLTNLRRRCPDRFAELQAELRIAWRARMRELLAGTTGRIILLSVDDGCDRGLGIEPLFVSAEMIADIGEGVSGIVRCDVSDLMNAEERARMVYPEKDHIAAARMLPPAAHERIALKLIETMLQLDGIAA